MNIKTKGIGAGSLTLSGKYKNMPAIDKTKTFTVSQHLNVATPSTKRSGESAPTGVVIINKLATITKGEEYVLIAIVKPAYYMWDNIVTFESSNPDIASVAFGVLKANGTGSCTITAKVPGTSFSDSFSLKVTAATETTISESEIYKASNPTSLTDATVVTNWLKSTLETASSGGYKKVLLPANQEYPVTPNVSETGVGVIKIPSNMVLDLNGSEIQIQKNNFTSTGYKFFMFDGCKNSSIRNGKIKGEIDQLESLTSGNEHCCSIQFKDATECGLENLHVYNSPGFNILTTRSSPDGVGGAAMVKDFNIEAGGYDSSGNKVDSAFSWRSKNPFWFEKEPAIQKYQLGSVWGYAGRIIDAELYDILWYDASGKLLEADFDRLKYYSYPIPAGAKKFNVVFHQKSQPKYTSYDYSIIFLYPISEPYKCYIRNCEIHHNCSTGIAMCGGQHWLIEGCRFYNNGYRDPLADVDYEDGWESMIGDIWRNNNFVGYGYGITLIAGYHIAFHNNYMNVWLRTNRCTGLRLYHNVFKKHRSGLSLNCNGDCVFSQNEMSEDDYTTEKKDAGSMYEFRVIDQY